MASVQVTRWRRYGKDRLYVKDADGHDLGWWDLVANSAHPTADETGQALRETVAAWQTSAGSLVTEPVTPPDTREPAPIPEPTPDPVRGPDFLPPESGQSAAQLVWPGPVEEEVVAPRSFPPPQGPPVTDLAYNRPGEQLADKVAAAREAGERPTLWRRFWLGKNAYSTWERGTIGERLVAEQLSRLAQTDPRWGFINSIPVSDEVDIDVFAVGPGGVFTINAKYHRGARIWVGGDTLLVNGTRQPYVRNSRHEARKASRLLTRATGETVNVQGIVVPVDANAFTVKTQPADVHVINRSRLNHYLRSRPEILGPDLVAHVYHAARLSSTWLPSS